MKTSTLTILFLVFVGLATWWLIRRKSPVASPADLDAYMGDQAMLAVRFAREAHSIELDFSTESIQAVEEILGKIHEEHSTRLLTDVQLEEHVIRWAGYIGEVAKRIRPGRWQRDSTLGKDTFPLEFDSKNAILPIAWVHKRITNGEEDNVWSKFRVSMMRDSLKELSADDLERIAEQEDSKKQ